jgi:hypothetical protein
MPDAVSIKPRFIPDEALLSRDDSGGMEYEPYTAAFGDGGHVTGAKKHLSVSGGREDAVTGDEESDGPAPKGSTSVGRGVGDNSKNAKRVNQRDG